MISASQPALEEVMENFAELMQGCLKSTMAKDEAQS
jgi:hypothetical protein